MPRSHGPDQDSPRASLATEYGTLQLTILDNKLIHVWTPYPDNHITVNRVQLTVSGRLRRAEDGTWRWEDSYHVTVDRYDGRRSGPGIRGVSWNAYEKIRDTIPIAVTQWADAHPELLRAGAIATRAQRMSKLEAELDEAVGRAGDLGAQIARLREEIATLQPNSE